MKSLIKQAIEKYLLAPFSNKVTRVLLFIGGALLAFPTIDYLIFDVIVNQYFDIDAGPTYPTESSFITGVVVLVMAVLHNVYITHQTNRNSTYELKLGDNYLKGNFSIEKASELIANAPVSTNKALDNGVLTEKYQPIIADAVFRIDEGNLEKAKELIHSVLNDMPLGIVGSAYLNYGYYCSASGKESDIEYYQVALRIFKDIGYQEGLPSIYRNLGESARRRHDFDNAERYQKEAISISENLNDEIELANSIGNLGLVFAQQCRHKEAEIEFQKSIEIYQRLQAENQIKRIRSYMDTMFTCPNYTRGE